MTGLPDATRSQAVLIGVGHYQLLPDLPGVHHNLPALAEALRDERVWGLPSRNCVIVEDPVLVTDILDPLINAAEEATDTLVVYYAGRAFVDPLHGELYLALAGLNPRQVHTAVPYRLIRDVLRGGRAARRIVILDCDYSGGAPATTTMGARALAAAARDPRTYLLASASTTSSALSSAHEPYTQFTGELLRIIQHGIANSGSLLDLDSISGEMRAALRAQGSPDPQVSYASALGQLTLIRNRGFRGNWWESPKPPPPQALPPGFSSQGSGPPADTAPPKPPREPVQGAPSPGSSGRMSPPAAAAAGPTSVAHQDVGAPATQLGRDGPRHDEAGDWVAHAVHAAVQRGLLVFNPPEEMRQGYKDRVEVGIARSASLRESLLGHLHGRGLPQFEEIETSSFMSVELKGDAFQITSYSALEQIVAPLARWEFDVVPMRAGVQTLVLCVCLRVALPQVPELGGSRLSVPVLERAIRIRVNVPYGTRRFLVGNWQWLVATAVGLGSGLAAWIALVH